MLKSKFSNKVFLSNAMLSALVVAFIAGGCNSSTNTPEADKSSPTSSPVAAETKTAKSSKIDINTAPIAELDKLELPGTKPSLSERIQAGRPYKQNDDLVTKKAISAEEFKLIQNLVTTETKK